MKNLAFLGIVLLFLASCRKKDAGKHCPLIRETKTAHLVDLTPIAWVQPIMDTLAKYPQLQVVNINYGWGVYDPSLFFASITCNIYYKGQILFDRTYSLYVNSDGIDSTLNRSFIPKLDLSAEPAISLEQANETAEETVYFEHCTVSRLGFSNKGTYSIPDYKLVWRIRGAELGLPFVEIDAQSGQVLEVKEEQIEF